MFNRKPKKPSKSDTNISNSDSGENVKISDLRGADPFIAAKREWNERYGDYISRARNWRFMSLILGVTTIILAAGMVYIGGQNKMVPYIVEVDKIGQVVNVSQASEVQPAGKRIIQAMLMRFMVDFRSVSLDAVVQKAATDRLYKMVPQGSAALAKINDHYRDSSPFVVAQSASVSIEPIGTPLPLSEHSWQIEWWETKRGLTGAIQSRKRYKAVAMVAFNPPKEQTQAFDLDNPIGLFVPDLNWSEQL